MNSLLIELPYMPSISWCMLVKNYDVIYLDSKEHYQKASYRNRCHIVGANGLQRLSIPLVRSKGLHTAMDEIKISYEEDWQKNHWQTITSCYRRSAYFEYYEDIFHAFYTKHYDNLFAYNFEILQVIFKLLHINKQFLFTETYIEPGTSGYDDYRSIFMPNKKADLYLHLPEYNQVFSDRMPFMSDLSILDLLCNKKNL